MDTKQLIELLAKSLELPLKGEDERLLKLIGTALVATGGALMALADADLGPPAGGKSVEAASLPPNFESMAEPVGDVKADVQQQPVAEHVFEPTVFESNVQLFEDFRAHLARVDVDAHKGWGRWLTGSVAGFSGFKHLPDETKRTYLELLVAMARDLHPSDFLKMYGLSGLKKSHVKNFVHGLAIVHEPRHGVWADDVKALYGELCPEVVQTVTSPVQKKASVAQAKCPVSVSPEVLAFSKGKVFAIVGGEPKAHASAALEEAFQLRELRWVTTKKKNQVQKALQAMANDNIDLAIVTVRFTSHGAQQQARKIDQRRVVFTKAYGVVEVEGAIRAWLKKGV